MRPAGQKLAGFRFCRIRCAISRRREAGSPQGGRAFARAFSLSPQSCGVCRACGHRLVRASRPPRSRLPPPPCFAWSPSPVATATEEAFCCLKFLTREAGEGDRRRRWRGRQSLLFPGRAQSVGNETSKHRVCRTWGSRDSGSDARGPDRSACDRYFGTRRGAGRLGAVALQLNGDRTGQRGALQWTAGQGSSSTASSLPRPMAQVTRTEAPGSKAATASRAPGFGRQARLQS